MGAETTTQTIDANNAAVRMFFDFRVDTTDSGGHAIAITGSGDLSYTDEVVGVSLTAAENALDIQSTGSTPDTVTVATKGPLTGGIGA